MRLFNVLSFGPAALAVALVLSGCTSPTNAPTPGQIPNPDAPTAGAETPGSVKGLVQLVGLNGKSLGEVIQALAEIKAENPGLTADELGQKIDVALSVNCQENCEIKEKNN